MPTIVYSYFQYAFRTCNAKFKVYHITCLEFISPTLLIDKPFELNHLFLFLRLVTYQQIFSNLKAERMPPKKSDGKKKKKKDEEQPQAENNENENGEEEPNLEEVEKSIAELREKGKEDPDSVDYVTELRKIQDKMADLMGKDRRPMTAKPRDDVESEEEEEEEEEIDPDKEVKELINKRLTSCMLLALSFEDDDSYPVDFYEKLASSKKIDEVTSPITKDEMKILNNLLKEKKPDAKKRVKKAGKNAAKE